MCITKTLFLFSHLFPSFLLFSFSPPLSPCGRMYSAQQSDFFSERPPIIGSLFFLFGDWRKVLSDCKLG